MKKGYCWCILIVASVHRRHERQPVYRSLQVLLLDIVKELNLNTPYAGKVTGLKVSRGAADAGLAKMGD